MHCHKTKQKITISCTNITPMQRMEHGSIQWICDLGNSSDVRVLALWHRRLAPAPSLQLYSCQKLHSRKWNWPKNLPSTYIDFSAFSRTKAIKLNEICLFCLIPIIPGHQTTHNTTSTLHDSNNFWMFAFQHLISSVNWGEKMILLLMGFWTFCCRWYTIDETLNTSQMGFILSRQWLS